MDLSKAKEIKEFEKIAKKINKNKYHINRVLKFNDKGEIVNFEWNIFRKDMLANEYFNSQNLEILSSKKNNTIEDIKKIIEE